MARRASEPGGAADAGLDGLTMRALGRELGVDPMAALT